MQLHMLQVPRPGWTQTALPAAAASPAGSSNIPPWVSQYVLQPEQAVGWGNTAELHSTGQAVAQYNTGAMQYSTAEYSAATEAAAAVALGLRQRQLQLGGGRDQEHGESGAVRRGSRPGAW